jgi:hypothetical protein
MVEMAEVAWSEGDMGEIAYIGIVGAVVAPCFQLAASFRIDATYLMLSEQLPVI